MWVAAKGWVPGEYKTCTTVNLDLQETTLHCDDDVVGKVFDVQFYGRTREPEKSESTPFTWTCQKNEGINPSMTCRDRK